MQKVMNVFFSVFIFLNIFIFGMKTDNVKKRFQHEVNFHEKIMYLIANDIPNERTNLGETQLFLASQRGFVDDIKLLMYAGANVNAQTHIGRTSLQIASQEGHIEVVKQLLSFGANILHKDHAGYTALDLAQKNGHDEIAELLHVTLEQDKQYVLARKKARLAKRKTW